MCPTRTTLRLKPITNDDTSEFRRAFAVMDADHDGKISTDDLRVFYAAAGDNEGEDDMIKAMINVADANKDGFVQYDEFEGMLSNVKKSESDNGVMEELFRVMDNDGDGRLGFDDLRSYLKLVGISVNDDEIKAMIKLDMTREMVERKGLVEATSNGVEVNENPTKAITNKEKRKTRPDVDDEVENRLISGNPGKRNSKKRKTLEVSKMAADAEVEEDGGDIEEDVENEMAIMTNKVTFDAVVTTTKVGGPLRKGRNGGWKRYGKMMVSADGIVIKTCKKVVDAYGSPGGLFKLIKNWLMERYDSDSRMFMIDERKYFVMTRDDVSDAFMLPCSSDRNEVLRTSSKKKNNPD
ncbi:hypothetical protein KSS87_015609 [Heliosperma pusillum]|nr:hypothetical protein KSS87_015609 [Heliosperma pusillum]